jgi:hypothetical protein
MREQTGEDAMITTRLQLAPATILPSYAESMPDLPDDFEEELMRWRHEVQPTPPMDEQLADVLGDDV